MKARLAAFAATVGGTGVAATLALGLLVCGCVFVAMAGPRASLGIRTRALHHTLATVPPSQTTVQASANTNEFEQAPVVANGASLANVTAGDLSTVKRQLARDLAADGLTLGPYGGTWAGISTPLLPVSGAGRAVQAGSGPRLEIVYRGSLGRYTRLVAGHYPTVASPAPSHGAAGGNPADTLIGVVVTQPMAARYGLHLGSRMEVTTAGGNVVTVEVSGVVAVRDPSASFWTTDATVAAPSEVIPVGNGLPYWTGAVLTSGPGLIALENAFSPTDLPVQWQFPLSLNAVSAGQAQHLLNQLNGLGARTPVLTGRLAASAADVAFASPGVTQVLVSFLAAQASVDNVLSLVFVGLAMIGVVVLLLAAQMVTARRAGEWLVLRARGASVWQLAGLAVRDTAVAVVPAVVVGGVLAVVLTPGQEVPLAWWLAAATVVIALVGPAGLAVVRYRPVAPGAVSYQTGALQPTGIANAGPRRTAVRRLVAEVTLTVAAVGGLVLLRFEGLGHSGVFTSAAPALVAVPAAICVLRVYPLVLRGVMRLSSRRAGVTGFLATARAGRAPATVLPVFALVLALSLAAFAGMIRDTVARGEAAASWQATGADAAVNAQSAAGQLSPAVVRSLAGVAGVAQVVTARAALWGLAGGGSVAVIAVDPASYAALAAHTPWPGFPAGKLARRAGGGPAPVLASPAAARVLGHGPVTLELVTARMPVAVAGVVSATPAMPGGGTFVIVPSWALPATVAAQPPDLMLITGPVDGAALTAAAHRLVPGAVVTLRSAALASLADSPLPRGAYLGFAVGLAAAAGFSAAILLLDLALAADSRRLTLARLATMGLATGQARRLTLLETLPAVVAAALAGAGCALVLVPLTGPILDLSAFTGSPAAVPVHPDLTALALPVAGLIILAAATLSLHTRIERHRGLTTALRTGH
jgi:putative ABC transport system permease protein